VFILIRTVCMYVKYFNCLVNYMFHIHVKRIKQTHHWNNFYINVVHKLLELNFISLFNCSYTKNIDRNEQIFFDRRQSLYRYWWFNTTNLEKSLSLMNVQNQTKRLLCFHCFRGLEERGIKINLFRKEVCILDENA
jgi:hypothetical protein